MCLPGHVVFSQRLESFLLFPIFSNNKKHFHIGVKLRKEKKFMCVYSESHADYLKEEVRVRIPTCIDTKQLCDPRQEEC